MDNGRWTMDNRLWTVDPWEASNVLVVLTIIARGVTESMSGGGEPVFGTRVNLRGRVVVAACLPGGSGAGRVQRPRVQLEDGGPAYVFSVHEVRCSRRCTQITGAEGNPRANRFTQSVAGAPAGCFMERRNTRPCRQYPPTRASLKGIGRHAGRRAASMRAETNEVAAPLFVLFRPPPSGVISHLDA